MTVSRLSRLSVAGAGRMLAAASLLTTLHCATPRGSAPATAVPQSAASPLAPEALAALQATVTRINELDPSVLLYEAEKPAAAPLAGGPAQAPQELGGHPFSRHAISLYRAEHLLEMLTTAAYFETRSGELSCSTAPELAVLAAGRHGAPFALLYSMSCGLLRISGPDTNQVFALSPQGRREFAAMLGYPRPPGSPPRTPGILVSTLQVNAELLDPKAVKQTVEERYQESLMSCYRTALAEQPELEGRIMVLLNIGADGAVTASSLQTATTQFARLDDCIAAAPKRWKLPVPKSAPTRFVLSLLFLPDVR